MVLEPTLPSIPWASQSGGYFPEGRAAGAWSWLPMSL